MSETNFREFRPTYWSRVELEILKDALRVRAELNRLSVALGIPSDDLLQEKIEAISARIDRLIEEQQ